MLYFRNKPYGFGTKMPIENLSQSQSQGRIFEHPLSKQLNPKNKLYQLRSLINWNDLESKALCHVDIKQFGRDRKSHRVMLALLMLQAMYNGSDSFTAEELTENMYWQYFCGYEYLKKDPIVSEATIRRFRNLLGETGYNEIMKELLRVGMKTGALKKKDLESAIIDTTVQIKNIKHPHDAYLMETARKKVVELCKELGISLNETYAKSFKINMIQLWKYSKDSKVKKRWKSLKKLKTLLGRLIRICERGIIKSNLILSFSDQETLFKSKKIHAQSVLKKYEKEEYKKDHKVLYSFHASEVECIGKGKLNKPYEFGNKVGIAISGRGNFILAVKSFHGNPYDGHTLDQTVEEVRKIVDKSFINKYFVDLGYVGSNFREKGKVYTPKSRKNLTKADKLMQKRRSAIEPIIGHLKNYCRMGRNYLKGKIGDIINPIISAIGLNLRCLANHLTKANLQSS
jgi:IS5 family transposase